MTFGPRNSSVKAIPEEPTGPVAEQKRYEAEYPITVPKHIGKPHPTREALAGRLWRWQQQVGHEHSLRLPLPSLAKLVGS